MEAAGVMEPKRVARAARDRGYYPTDLVLLVYVFLAAALLLVSPRDIPGKALLTAGYALGAIAIAALRFFPRTRPALWRGVRDLYPLAALPIFYGTLCLLNRLVTVNYYDAIVVQWEQAIFGFQPSQELMHRVPNVVLSEYLHLSYLCYLPLIPAVPVYLYLTRQYEGFRTLTTSVLTVFVFCYVAFILFPVQGPFHHFGPIDPSLKPGIIAYVVDQVVKNNSSLGTAFPSSHVAVVVTIWMVSRPYVGRRSWIVLAVAIGIFGGTVYGGFHYAVDTLAGLFVGLLFGWLGPKLYARLQSFLKSPGGDPA